MANDYTFKPSAVVGSPQSKPQSFAQKILASIGGTPGGTNKPDAMSQRSATVLPRMGPSAGGTYSEMFKDLIPNVNFNKITLSGGTGTAPLKVKLNLVLRDIIEEDGVSDWFANSFEDDENSSPFEKYLKLNILQCTNPDVCEVLSGRQNTQFLIDKGYSRKESESYVVNRSVNLDSKINISGDPDSKGIEEYRIIGPGGEEIIEVPFEESFVVNPTDATGVQHLSYFVWITLDTEKMANDFNMSEEFFAEAEPATSVYSEYVIQDGKVMMDMTVFLLPTGDVWQGDVHYHDPAVNPDPNNPSFKGYMTGRVHSQGSQYLEERTMSNNKIRDFRYVNRVEERYRSVMQARIGAGLAEGEAEVGQAIQEDIISKSVTAYTELLGKEVQPEQKSSAFSDLWLSVDEAHNANGMFSIDYVTFLKNNCAYPYLWSISEETTIKLLSLAKIRDLRIYRRQVDPHAKAYNRLGTPSKPMLTKDTFKKYKRKLVCRTYQLPMRNICQRRNLGSGFIAETKVDLFGSPDGRNDGIRWFTFTDKNMMSLGNGTYQYTVQLSTLDPTVELLRRNFGRLRLARRRLVRYRQEAYGYTRTKPNFDIYVDKYIPEFINRFYEPKNQRWWKDAGELYLAALREISNVLEQPAYPGADITLETVLPATLSSYLDPAKGSPEGIETVIIMIDSMLKELSDKIQNVSVGRTNYNKNPYSSGGTSAIKGKGAQRMIRKAYTFGSGQEIVLAGQRGKGYDFITNQTLDFANENIKGQGLRTVTSRYYRKRCEIETKRYFKINQSGKDADLNFNFETALGMVVPDINLADTNPNDSLIGQKFTYLTPSFVFQSFGAGLAGFFGTGASSPPAAMTGVLQDEGVNETILDFMWDQKVESEKVSYDLKQTGGNLQGLLGVANAMKQKSLLNVTIKDLIQPTSIPLRDAGTPEPQPKNEQQEAPKNIDDVQASVIAAQISPDFSLFPVSVKGYSPPGTSKLDDQQQIMKKQYMELLSSRGCQVVSAVHEFDLFGQLGTKANARTFNVDDSNPADELINEPQGPDYENIDFAEDVGIDKLAPLARVQPIIPKEILNINPTPLLSALGNAAIGFHGGPASGPLAYKSLHVSNFQLLNFQDQKTPNLLDGVNPSNKVAVLKKLPNQLKSLVLAGTGYTLLDPFATTLIEGATETPPVETEPWFFKSENMAKIFQMFANIARIEFLFTFDTPVMQYRDKNDGLIKSLGSRNLIKSPKWLPLTRQIVDALEEGEKKVALLCRISKYKNRQLGIGESTAKELPIIDKYFTMVIDPFADPDSGLIDSASDGDLDGDQGVMLSTSSAMGNGNSNIVSSSSSTMKLWKKHWMTRLDEDGDEVLVQEFDGNLTLSNNCDDGGT